MLFGAARPGQQIQFEPGVAPVLDPATGRKTRGAVRSKVITFKAFGWKDTGIPCNKEGVKTNYHKPGYLMSRLDTEKEAERLGVDVHDLNKFILNHPSYGVEFVRVDLDAGDEVVGNPDGLGDGFTDTGDGIYCAFCKGIVSKDARGLVGHKRKKTHLKAVEAHKLRLEAKMAV